MTQRRPSPHLAILALAGLVAAAPLHATAAEGKAVYQKNCAACHQATGKGIPGAFPALAGNTFVQGPARDPASVLLKGRGGMPDFSQSLNDDDIAAVLTYARSSWGNQAPGLSAGDVTALRTEISVGMFSAGQLSNKH
jgi:cytochrome c6